MIKRGSGKYGWETGHDHRISPASSSCVSALPISYLVRLPAFHAGRFPLAVGTIERLRKRGYADKLDKICLQFAQRTAGGQHPKTAARIHFQVPLARHSAPSVYTD